MESLWRVLFRSLHPKRLHTGCRRDTPGRIGACWLWPPSQPDQRQCSALLVGVCGNQAGIDGKGGSADEGRRWSCRKAPSGPETADESTNLSIDHSKCAAGVFQHNPPVAAIPLRSSFGPARRPSGHRSRLLIAVDQK
jgi:hypothetical protein